MINGLAWTVHEGVMLFKVYHQHLKGVSALGAVSSCSGRHSCIFFQYWYQCFAAFACVCLLGACSSPQSVAELDYQKPAMGYAQASCDGVSGTCFDFDLGDRHAIALPASSIFNTNSANLSLDALQTLMPIARAIKEHSARWVSVGVFSQADDALTHAVAQKQAQILVDYFTSAHVGARIIYQQDRPVDTIPGLQYFTGTTSQVAQVKIEYGM